MKEYYIFNLKKEFAKLYKDKQDELFYIFNRIYYMKEIDKEYGFNLFEQVCDFNDKEDLNDFIYEYYKDNVIYSKTSKDEHIINDLYSNEVSILTVKNSNIRIESNIDNPSFLELLKKYNKDLFVCDFKSQEFFLLKRNRYTIKN
jgi:Protein of unknown function (DUF2522).